MAVRHSSDIAGSAGGRPRERATGLVDLTRGWGTGGLPTGEGAVTSYESLHAYGVQPGYRDAYGIDRRLPETTAAALTAHVAGRVLPAPALIATPGRFHPELVGELTYEGGGTVPVAGIVEREGYHVLHSPSGDRRLVIAAPEYLPQPRRQWGFAVQLYAARTRDSWGIGDFRDLATIARCARDARRRQHPHLAGERRRSRAAPAEQPVLADVPRVVQPAAHRARCRARRRARRSR